LVIRIIKLKDIPLENQPRERLKRSGITSLSDAELLAIILQKGTKGENVIDMCNRVLKEEPENLSLQELKKIKGIGEAKAMQIQAIYELAKRKKKNNSDITIKSANDVYQKMSFLANKKKEYLFCLFLDAKNKIIDKPEEISVGILDASLIHPREIFKEAVKKSSKSIILVHNHPSGDTLPSQDDIKITKRLIKAGEILDVKILDHVIVGDGFFSMLEKGIFD